MLNSMAANRRLALRSAACQAVVAAVIAALFLFTGYRESLAAATGGGAVLLGSLLLSWRALAGSVQPSAGLALAGLISGLVLKWFVVFAVLYLALARWQLPPLPLLLGVIGATTAVLINSKFKAQVSK